MKLSRAMAMVGCVVIGVACVWAAETAPTAAPTKTETTPVVATKTDAAPSGAFKTDLEKASYAIGYKAGNQFRTQDAQLDLAMLIQGLKDGLGGQKPALPEDEATNVLAAFGKEMQAKMTKKRQEMAATNLAASKTFLEANAKKEGVKVLPSGLQYKVLKEGTGKSPLATDRVKVNYRGTLADGTEFDSSYKRGTPAEFLVKGVIKGWTEGLQLMKEGAKWELTIPADLAYGEAGRPNIPPNSALVFEVELLEVAKPDPNAPAGAKPVQAPIQLPNPNAPAGAKPAPAPVQLPK